MQPMKNTTLTEILNEKMINTGMMKYAIYLDCALFYFLGIDGPARNESTGLSVTSLLRESLIQGGLLHIKHVTWGKILIEFDNEIHSSFHKRILRY